MWVMTFHSACARILRADAERLGYTRAFTIYDEADSLRCQALHGRARDRPEALPAAGGPGADLGAPRTSSIDAAGYAEASGRRSFEADRRPRSTRSTSSGCSRRTRWTSTTCWSAPSTCWSCSRTSAGALPAEPSATCWSTSTRTPTTPSTGCCSCSPASTGTCGRRRRRPVDLLLPRRRHPQHPRLRARLPRAPRWSSSSRTTARRRRSSTRPTRSSRTTASRSRRRCGPRRGRRAGAARPSSSDEHEEARFVAGEIERLVSEEGMRARGDRDLLPHQRPEPGARGHAGALRDPVPGDRRHQVLRAGRDQGRARLPELLANPADAISLAADHQLAAARDRRPPARGGCSRMRTRPGSPIWEVARRAAGVPGLGAAAMKAVGRFAEMIEPACASAPSDGAVAELLEAGCSESGYLEALEAERTIEAEGRLENLQELVGVAPSSTPTASRGRQRGLRRWRSSSQQISLYTEQDSIRDDESAGHADDAPQRQGARVRRRLHDRLRGGRLPAHARVDEGNLEEERRLCYVGITRARERLYLTCARRAPLFGGARLQHALALPRRAARPSSPSATDGGAERRAAPAGAAGGGAAPRSRIDPAPALEVATGDDVVHATFGEGVVTGVEPGGVVVVRFAGDGRERKLMADYAPLRSRVMRVRAGHRRQGGRRRGARAGRASTSRVRGGRRPHAGPRDGAGRRRPRLPHLRANKHRACAEAGIRSIHHELPRRDRRGRAGRPGRRAERRRRGPRDPGPAPAARAHRRGRGDRRDRPGQGRRRPHRRQAPGCSPRGAPGSFPARPRE